MKHLLNNMTEEQKNAIREQHSGGMKIDLGKFKQMVETKLGDPKPFLNEKQIVEQGLFTNNNPEINKIIKECVTSLRLQKLNAMIAMSENPGTGIVSFLTNIMNPFSKGPSLEEEVKSLEACVTKKNPKLSAEIKKSFSK